MQKALRALIVLIGLGAHLPTQAQTATNFTANDCAGNSHELFADLNTGKVVVLVWVMPCSSCTDAAVTAYNVAQTYEASQPGKVLYYLADDYANTSCPTLTNWTNGNVASGVTVFSSTAVNQSDYGTPGMPKVVVMGGGMHGVFFNKNDDAANDPTGIQSAIDAALLATSTPDLHDLTNATWYWNATDNVGVLKLNATTAGELRYTVLNLLGQAVTTETKVSLVPGGNAVEVKANGLVAGSYLLRADINGASSTFKLIVR